MLGWLVGSASVLRSPAQFVLTVRFVRLGLLDEKRTVKRMSMTRLEGGLVALQCRIATTAVKEQRFTRIVRC